MTTTRKEWGATDLANAERLVERSGGDLRFVPPWRQWLRWDDRRWAGDDDGEVMRRAKASALAIHVEASEATGQPRRELLSKHAIRSEGEGRLRAAIALAETEPGIPVKVSDLDTHPMLLNVRNGTLDLETGRLRDPERADLITRMAPVVFDEAATCPTWLRFLGRVLAEDAELIAFMQLAVGYTLTGMTDEQVLFLLIGTGANGKTVFQEILRRLLGREYSAQADFSTFLDGRRDGPRNDLAALVGMRMVAAAEANEGRRFDEALVKSVTGGEPIVARKLYADLFEFVPAFKLWLAANAKPQVRSTGEALWRRMRVIPFAVTIPEGERDPRLLDKLTAELPGVLNWALEGCLRWQRDGLGHAAAISDATSLYRAESDVLAVFLEDVCEVHANARVATADLFTAYTTWCKHNEERAVSKIAFGQRLADRGFVAIKGAKGRRAWQGLLLRAGGEVAQGGTVSNFFPHEGELGKESGNGPMPPLPTPPESLIDREDAA